MGLHVVVVGLGFGSSFVPIYQRHPQVESVGICEIDAGLLKEAGEKFGVDRLYGSLEEVLADDRVDAVHLLTPVPLHVQQTLAVLNSGKHCACAVPMAAELDDLHRIVAAQRASGKNYMMMETAAYMRETLYALDLLDRGELGNVTFYRGAYYQDLDGDYPRYWKAVPPMHYATHVVGPILALARTRMESVCCFGSGTLRSDIQQPGANTFPLETAIFRLAGTNIAAEVTRAWYQTARAYCEAFSVYGDKLGFEWQQIETEDPVLFELEPVVPGRRWRDAPGRRVHVPYRPDLLPPELAEFANGGHGGAHPHLVHEFISSIVEGRPAAIDAIRAADWCAPGICAHLSALQEGEKMMIPTFP